MSRAIDWRDIADKLNREREAINESLPPGVECFIVLSTYGYGLPTYFVTVSHKETKATGGCDDRTPRLAAAKALKDLEKVLAEMRRRPRLATPEVKALPNR